LAGYDLDRQAFGLGVGSTVTLTHRLEAFGEYYPLLAPASGSGVNRVNTFTFGLKARTFGHHFFIYFGNNYLLTGRHYLQRTARNDLYLGLALHRLFMF
jgi:hypothetical protein